VPVLSLDEYAQLVADCVAELPPNMVVHRLTGDGPKRILIAPQWSGDKKRVLNRVNRELEARGLR
jgi:radical SAM superfamily enzyme